MKRAGSLIVIASVFSASVSATETPGTPLIVVQDLGGVSALPYYRALNLQTPPPAQGAPHSPLPVPTTPATRYSEADLLPVRSMQLSPGRVTPRVIHAAGLTPIFLIGDDARSRTWLHERIETLRGLGAIGFVVNVESKAALDALRARATGLTLVPASGDDLALRLNLRHYPVLITATGIEQ